MWRGAGYLRAGGGGRDPRQPSCHGRGVAQQRRRRAAARGRLGSPRPRGRRAASRRAQPRAARADGCCADRSTSRSPPTGARSTSPRRSATAWPSSTGIAPRAPSPSRPSAGCISQGGGGGRCAAGRALDEVWGVAVSPDGRNVYAVSAKVNTLAALARDESSGTLAQLPGRYGCFIRAGGLRVPGGTRAHGRRGGHRQPGRAQRLRGVGGRVPRRGGGLPEEGRMKLVAVMLAASAAARRRLLGRGAGIPGGGPRRRTERGGADDRRSDGPGHGAPPPDATADRGAGVTFTRSYVSYPVCCPSRATFLTGQYAHNNDVHCLYAWCGGGYGRLNQREYLPVWLERAGYATAHIGKFLNGYGRERPPDIPRGWTEWYGLVDHSTYRMWGYTMYENGRRAHLRPHAAGDPALLPDGRAARGRPSASSAGVRPDDAPFFLSVAFLAPHHESGYTQRLTGKLVEPRRGIGAGSRTPPSASRRTSTSATCRTSPGSSGAGTGR